MKKLKRWGKLCALCLTAALSISAFSGCFLFASIVEEALNKGDEAFQLTSDLTVSWTFDEEMGWYNVQVEGVAKNVTDKAWDGVNVTVMLYDGEGNSLGSAYDYIEYVGENGTWRFCATGTTKYEPISAELYELTAYNSFLY